MKSYLKLYYPSHATLYDKDSVVTISYGFEERIKLRQMLPEVMNTITELHTANFLVAISVHQSEVDNEVEQLLHSFSVVHKQEDGDQYLVNVLLDNREVTAFVEKCWLLSGEYTIWMFPVKVGQRLAINKLCDPLSDEFPEIVNSYLESFDFVIVRDLEGYYLNVFGNRASLRSIVDRLAAMGIDITRDGPL